MKLYGVSFVLENRGDEGGWGKSTFRNLSLFFAKQSHSLSGRFCKELTIWGMRAWEILALSSFKNVVFWDGKLCD